MNPRRLCRVAIFAIVLGVLTTLAFAWVLPPVLMATGLTHPAPWSPDRFWIDDTRGGHYQTASETFIAATHFQHIIFTGAPNQQEYYLKDPPPRWAFTLLHSMKGDAPADTREWWGVDTLVTGWPLRAFRGGIYYPWPARDAAPAPFTLQSNGMFGMPVGVGTQSVGVFRFGGASGDRFTIPVRPIITGLILNILIFSTEWMTILAMFGFGRA